MIITPENCKGLTDNEIIEKARLNLDFFSCLFQRYEAPLLRYIRRVSGAAEEEAQDILQEAFIKVWRNLNDFDPGMKFSVWLYRIVHNEAVSHLRKKKSFGKDRKTDAGKYANLLWEVEDDDSDTAEKSLLAAQLLEKLPVKYRDVLILKFLEKKSYEEISDILRIPEGTVAVRINRGKKMLRDLVES